VTSPGAPPPGAPPPANPPPPSNQPATPIAPAELDQTCKGDTAHPRRALRFASGELLATLRAIAPFDEAAVPAGFAGSPLPGKIDPGLTVSRAFTEGVDGIATAIAAKIVAAPAMNSLAALGCPLADFGKNEACTTAFLAKASARLFRGMGTPADVTNLLALTKGVAQRSDGKTALEIAVRAMVQNPRTLYLLEGLDVPMGSNPATPSLLSPGELASFLSYRVSGKPPSEGLVAGARTLLAGSPTLQGLQQLIDASFTAADLQRGAADFLATSANVAEIGALMRDMKKHPMANAAFMQRLQAEAYDGINAATKLPGVKLAQLLTAEQRTALGGDTNNPAAAKVGRPGLFLLPGVIAGISSVDHTDIPRRGRFLLKQLFCDSVPSPPAGLVTMEPPPPPKTPERVRFENIEKQPACGGCHIRVNRLGFAIEAYDEMGVARTEDEYKNPIVTASTHLVPGAGDLTWTDARDLFTRASTMPVIQNCFAIQTFRHIARRDERGVNGVEDACLIRDVAAAGRSSGFGVIDMFREALARAALARRGS
jgi:hypothetical protein